MKKMLTIAAVLLAAAALGAASMISQPAATVNLIRNEVITTDELDQQVARLQAAGAQDINPLDALQTLINDKVFLQGAERDGITISDRQLESNYRQVFNNAVQQAAQYGQTITEDDFRAEIIRQFGSVEAYMAALKNQAIMQMDRTQEKGEEIQAAVTEPTEAGISSFYRQNQQGFFQPENVKLAHIYKEKAPADAEDAEAVNAGKKAALEKVSEDIKSGAITFEAAVATESEDEGSRSVAGDIGWLAYNNEAARQGWGDEFCDAVLAMQPGQVSDVLESNMGYHIVKVSVHNPAKILTLDDPVSPGQAMTVREYIVQLLMSRSLQLASADALQDMVTELRNEARINILYKGTGN